MNTKIRIEIERLLHSHPKMLFDNEQLIHCLNATFGTEFTQLEFIDIEQLTETVDNAVLKKYFSRVWQPQTKRYKYSGLSIIDEVNALNPDLVLDIGCGYNEFRGKIRNLVGVDAYNDRADVLKDTLSYKPDQQADVAICFGSINFGDTEKIMHELAHVIGMIRDGGRIYFRVNPGLPHPAPESKWIQFYNWSPEFALRAADALGVMCSDMHIDENDRLYFVYHK